MYKFQEIFCIFDIKIKVNKDSFVFVHDNNLYCFNHDYYSSYIKEIFYFFDKNWKEHLKNYIITYKPCSTFLFPLEREITEEDLFYWKLKIPDNKVFDILFGKSNHD